MTSLFIPREFKNYCYVVKCRDVPEGGGWLSRVINTLAEYNNHNKIIIMVGHGLLELIPKKEHIINLKLENNNHTELIQRI